MYNCAGRKEKQSSQDLWPWIGDSGKRGFYGQTLILHQTTDWASHSWGPAWRRQTPFAGWRTVGTDRKHEEGGTPCETSVCTLVSPEAGWTEVCSSSCRASRDCFIVRPGPRQANLWPHVLHATVWPWIWDDQDLGKDCALGGRGDSVLSWTLGGLWWPLLAPTQVVPQKHPGFMRVATVSYSLTAHPAEVKGNHTGPASPVEHRGCWRCDQLWETQRPCPHHGAKRGLLRRMHGPLQPPVTRHSPSQANTLASLSPRLSTALELGRCEQGRTWPCALSERNHGCLHSQHTGQL